MSVRVLLVSDRTEIEETLREDPAANAYWLERRPPDLVVPAEAAREFAIVLVDFETTPDALGLARTLRAANKAVEVIAIAAAENERLAAESLKSGIFDYLLWPPNEPGALWDVLAVCAKKVLPAEPEFPIPFGRYTLLSRLGVGGMAEVFLADTGTPPRKVVVKRMLQSLAADDFVAMFMDEARISSALVHPNIVRVYDFGRVEESLYIAMEYVPGRNLEQLRLSLGGPFPPSIACYIVAEMCAGLGHAHTKVDSSGSPLSIVHRDVNPPNVLIADDGRVMITDFGIAKAAHRYYETTSGTLKGKFEYMSPEQANGKPVDRRADVFCAGLVLYELLTGTRPFMAPTPIETLFLIQACNPEPPSRWNARLPKMLDDICMKSLAKSPGDRYSEASELERDLREFARGSMNPGPRDLATFTKSVAKSEPVIPKPIEPAPPAAASDGKVTALLHRMKQKEGARAGDPPTGDGPTLQLGKRPAGVAALAGAPAEKFNPLVAAALEDETPARPMTVPVRPPPGAPAPVSAPPGPPHLQRAAAPPPVSPAAAPPPSVTVTDEATFEPRRDPARAPAVSPAGELPRLVGSSSGDLTVPGVLAALERGEPSESTPPPNVTSGGTFIVPADPAPPLPTHTGSAELFPTDAKNQDRLRSRLQLGGAIAGGVALSIVMAALIGPGVVSLLSPEPTPYAVRSTATPAASATITSMAIPTTAPAATPVLTPATPIPTPAQSAVPRVSPVPSRTAMSVATATPTRPPATPIPSRAPAAKGTLSIWVEGWATVEIDGRAAGNAPFVGVPISAGKHRLVLTNSKGQRKEMEIVVQPGKETKVPVSF